MIEILSMIEISSMRRGDCVDCRDELVVGKPPDDGG